MGNPPGQGRALFVGIAAHGHGGIQAFNRRVAAALASLAVPADVVMRADEGDWRFARRALRLLPASDLLLIGHVNLLPLAALHRLVRPRGRRILFAHGIEVWGDPTYRAVRRWEPALLSRTISQVAVVSGYSRDRMAAAFGLPHARFTIFPNAVDLPPDAPPARGTRQRLVLAVSRLGAAEGAKNLDALIRALPLIPDARLMIVGEGPLRDSLRRLAETLGVAGRVDLPGALDPAALAHAFAVASVFALPSSKEGFGIVYLEAWAAGLPVVGSCHGAAGEVIRDGIDGFTIDPADIAALAERLRRLLDDPALAQAMAAAGRARVAQHYSAPAFVANLRALIAA
ncbi:glycosyltransferase family 4 protein [Sphingomonas panaciterrae]|uniref:glycosyltransferase family 4 protein n=1 Tax=Sphingomonas panaciterrae TaxID=1462999 RepID=UPI002FEECE42